MVAVQMWYLRKKNRIFSHNLEFSNLVYSLQNLTDLYCTVKLQLKQNGEFF